MTQEERIARQDELRKLYEIAHTVADIESIATEFESLYDANQRLAISLHNLLCREDHNHSDCTFYDECDDLYHDWNGRSHQEYLTVANDIINISGASIESIERVVSVVSIISKYHNL